MSGRYARQTLFPGIGEEGQKRLGNSSVVIIGCGALGTTVATVMVRAGVGRIRIIDRDFIEEHNLQRQILFNEKDIKNHLNRGLAQIPGVILYQPEGSLKQAAVVSFNLKGWEPAEVGAVLDQDFEVKVRTGLHCAPAAHKTIGTYPQGTVRISLGYFNTLKEVNFTLEAVSKIARAKTF